MLVAGVDGCKGGWLVARVEAERFLFLESVQVVPSFRDMLDLTRDCVAVGVDIPIGLMGRDPRQPDREARGVLGSPRASSVFPAPVRAVLSCYGYREACDVSQAVCGKRISKQLFMILPKIREADAAMTPELQERIVEVHPEVCFWKMNGCVTVPASKHTQDGLAQRRALLSEWYTDDLSHRSYPARANLDDFLDACAAAWTASRVARGIAQRLPPDPARDERGLRMEIVY